VCSSWTNLRRFLSLLIYGGLVENLSEVTVGEAMGHKSKMNLNTSVQVNDVHPRALPELVDEVAEVLATVTKPLLETVLFPEA